MRAEFHTTLAGEAAIEIIAETKFERDVLHLAWKQRGYPIANGQSRFDDGGIGFYIPLIDIPKVQP